MHGFGVLLVFLSVISVVYGLLQRRKANKIAGAAHHATGELAQNPTIDPKRHVSAEGTAQP